MGKDLQKFEIDNIVVSLPALSHTISEHSCRLFLRLYKSVDVREMLHGKDYALVYAQTEQKNITIKWLENKFCGKCVHHTYSILGDGCWSGLQYEERQ